MARGRSITFEYILEADRGLPIEEQTLWEMYPLGGFSGGDVAELYSGAERVKNKGFREVSAAKYKAADKETWMRMMAKIRNYAFNSKRYPDYAKSPVANKEGFVPVIETEEMILAVGEDISLSQFNELFQAALDGGDPSASAKKKFR